MIMPHDIHLARKIQGESRYLPEVKEDMMCQLATQMANVVQYAIGELLQLSCRGRYKNFISLKMCGNNDLFVCLGDYVIRVLSRG